MKFSVKARLQSWFKGGMKASKQAIPVASWYCRKGRASAREMVSLRGKGFYLQETIRGRTACWTNGHGTLDCHLASPREIRWVYISIAENGPKRNLEVYLNSCLLRTVTIRRRTNLYIPIPHRLVTSRITLELRCPTFHPKDINPIYDDTRDLGIALAEITFAKRRIDLFLDQNNASRWDRWWNKAAAEPKPISNVAAPAESRPIPPQPRKILILGGGGHAKVIIDMLLQQKDRYVPVGCVVDNPTGATSSVLGVPIIGDDRCLAMQKQNGISSVVVAIGNNVARKKIFHELQKLGFELPSIVSDRSIVSPFARLGAGVVIMPQAVVGPDSTIGDGAIINTGATVDHDCVIGPFAHIAPGCSLAGSVSVGELSFLGVGTAVIPERRIGTGVMVGAGAVVNKDIENGETVVGVPARPIQRS